jgi:two-component sensor histidine kinase
MSRPSPYVPYEITWRDRTHNPRATEELGKMQQIEASGNEMTLPHNGISQAAVWMQEARHRVANLQHLVTNVDYMLDRGHINSEDGPRMVRRAAALLQSYEALKETGNEPSPCSADLKSIAGGLVEMFGRTIGSVILVLDVQPIELAGDRRRALLLATSELVINALRHAFAGRRFGIIQISLGCDQEQDEATMRVTDDGVGPDQIGGGSGLGCHIIGGLAGVLNGNVVWGRSPLLGGTEAVLTFRLSG